MTSAVVAEPSASASAWSPLRRPAFRALWTASLAANVGMWMQIVGAVWLMTSLTPSAAMVAFVQAALTAPLMLFGLLAGALADVVDRRRLLLWSQIWQLAAVAALGALTLAGLVTPASLLAMTFLFGIGAAMSGVAWQVVPLEVVSGSELPPAVALNGVSINLARAIGPTMGGLLVVVVGPGSTFLLNATVFVVPTVILLLWRSTVRRACLPPEHLIQAMAAGARFVRYEPPLRTVLGRLALFVTLGVVLWALLPLVASQEVGLDALGYGALLGCAGVGSVGAALLLPRLRRFTGTEGLVALATVLFAPATVALAFVRNPFLLGIVLMVGGAAWLAAFAGFMVAAQSTVPSWVRARATAVVMLVFSGGMTVGSVLWGVAVQVVGTPGVLTVAALALLLSLAAAAVYRLPGGEAPDLTPSRHWAEPHLVREPPLDRGPVLVTVEYRIDPARADDFIRAMRDVRLDRLRNGAMRWNLFSDPADPGRYVELIEISSWAEHLRAHERVTIADSSIEARAKAFHVGDAPTVSTHLIAEPVP